MTAIPLYGADDQARIGSSLPHGPDPRDAFEIDRARILHSFSFRRLQSKTQIYGRNESAFLRTRLTHSLEVSSIGRSLTMVLNRQAASEGLLPEPILPQLIEAACLAHDLGHPPFGHRGEEALNYCVWNRWPDGTNGFEGNGHTLRIVTNEELEVHVERHGLNLTRAMLLAVVKYPGLYREVVNPSLYPGGAPVPPFRPWAPPKCLLNEEEPVRDWLLECFPREDRDRFLSIMPRPGKHGRCIGRTLESSIVELADDIAYGTHDVEDAFFAGLISADTIISYLDRDAFSSADRYQHFTTLLHTMETGVPGKSRADQVYEKKGAASQLVGDLVASARLIEDPAYRHPRLRWTATLPHDERVVLNALQESVYRHVINGAAVQSLEYRGGIIIHHLFDALVSSPELLSGKTRHRMDRAESEEVRLRVLADYIAGMTDDYAERLYNRLFQPGHGSIFDRM